MVPLLLMLDVYVSHISVSVKQKKRMDENKYSNLDYEAIGRRIKLLRGNMQQIEFANEIGLKQQDVSKIEKAKLKPSLDVLRKISLRFGKTIEWILTGQNTIVSYAPANESAKVIMEALTPYASSTNISPSCSPPDVQDALKYAITAYKILTSGTGYASALKENITWFDEAVDDKTRIRSLEEKFETLKEQLLASGTLSSK